MAIEDFWESKDVCRTVYSGIITGQELIDSALEKSGDARFDDIRFVLSDWRPAIKVHISPEDIKHLVACLRSISKLCPHAYNASVLNKDETGVALTAWYKYLADDLSWHVELFYDIDEARAWYDKHKSSE